MENKVRSLKELIDNQIKYKEWTTQEIFEYTNGCGGKGSFIPVPQFIFRASCNHHDINYLLGGCEKDRLKSDVQFYEMMLLDCNNHPFLFKYFYKFWAYVYYKAVRICGKKYFNYIDKKA